MPGTETPHPACPATCSPSAPGWLPTGAGLEQPWGSWSITPAEQGYGVPLLQGVLGSWHRIWVAGCQAWGCRVPWCVAVDVWGELGPGLERRDVVLSAATAPCASEGASSALEQDPAQHKWLLEPLRCLGKWLGIALTAGELCWGIGPLQHTQHPSPLQCLQHPPPLDALSILLFSDTLSVLSQCRLLPGRPSLEVPLCPKMATWTGEGWAGRTILSPRWDLPHTWRALS